MTAATTYGSPGRSQSERPLSEPFSELHDGNYLVVTCSADGCDSPAWCKGLCRRDYHRGWYDAKQQPDVATFGAKVKLIIDSVVPTPDGCLIWPGPFRGASPIVTVDGRRRRVVEVVYWLGRGKTLGAERRLFRTCPNTACAAPSHVTTDPNSRYRDGRPTICTKCGETKPIDCFGPNAHRRAGRQSWCRDCSRAHRRVTRGVRPADATRRPGVHQRCQICDGTGGARGLHLDHDHATGVFRGWLCSPCNSAIGYFADDPERCALAAQYLRGVRA